MDRSQPGGHVVDPTGGDQPASRSTSSTTWEHALQAQWPLLRPSRATGETLASSSDSCESAHAVRLRVAATVAAARQGARRARVLATCEDVRAVSVVCHDGRRGVPAASAARRPRRARRSASTPSEPNRNHAGEPGEAVGPAGTACFCCGRGEGAGDGLDRGRAGVVAQAWAHVPQPLVRLRVQTRVGGHATLPERNEKKKLR